jgi:aconitate hydratase
MGILPLQFKAGETVESLGLTGEETFSLSGLKAMLDDKFAGGKEMKVTATAADGSKKEFVATVRIDTPQEILYYQHGGILQYVLRQLAGKA